MSVCLWHFLCSSSGEATLEFRSQGLHGRCLVLGPCYSIFAHHSSLRSSWFLSWLEDRGTLCGIQNKETNEEELGVFEKPRGTQKWREAGSVIGRKNTSHLLGQLWSICLWIRKQSQAWPSFYTSQHSISIDLVVFLLFKEGKNSGTKK
jgi:hypothetical protein